ncbi:aldolase [Morchella conica CCBAS932]|uniref:Aldolase n=1 Tax=Morchella conica CCBAS932 TaxID=1392247 RepID=A0A3N4L458_9PEZI|nr:aldolase [Morchella conica CCBAS932]
MSRSLPPAGGIYVPVPTFFVSKSASTYSSTMPPLDLEAQAAHSIHLAKSGCRGLVLLGSTGEAVHLTRAERVSQISYVRQALEAAGFKDYPLIAGTATNGIEETVQLLAEAKEAGAGWGLVLAPGYFAGAADQAGIRGWFEAVADESPIPVMIYHYPGVSNNVKILPSTFRALAAHPNIVGGKLSHGDISVHAQIALDPTIDTDHFHLFTGLGQQLFPVLQVGCFGAIDGLAGIFPKSVVALYNLVTAEGPLDMERLQKIRALQYMVSSAEELIVSWGTVGIKEAVSRVLGFGDVDGGRLPLAKGMGEGEWARWAPIMADMGKIEAAL